MRNGISSAYRIGKALCRILFLYKDSIVRVVGGESETAIEAVLAACDALEAILAPFVNGP